MNADAQNLIQQGRDLQRTRDIGFRTRVQIERSLFALARLMAKDVLNIDIHGFSRADRLKVLNHTPVRSSDTAAQSSVLEAFELNEGLGVLSSSDPYATSEKWNLSHGTREQAVEAFGKRLSEYGQNVPSGNV